MIIVDILDLEVFYINVAVEIMAVCDIDERDNF